MDIQAKIAIENAKLTHQTIQNLEQVQLNADNKTPQPPQPPEGVPNGNIG
jgi:hypothetical protein